MAVLMASVMDTLAFSWAALYFPLKILDFSVSMVARFSCVAIFLAYVAAFFSATAFFLASVVAFLMTAMVTFLVCVFEALTQHFTALSMATER